MGKTIRLIIILVAIAGVIAGGVYLFRSRQTETDTAEDQVLRTEEVTRGSFDVTVVASGEVIAGRKLSLNFGTPGTVDEIQVEVGDEVSQGQPLAALETSDLEQAVEQAALSLEQARLNLTILQEPVDAEEIQLTELSIRDASNRIDLAEASKTYEQAQGSWEMQQARERAEDAREAYEEVLDRVRDLGLDETKALPAQAIAQEAEGNVGITQVKVEYDIQQAESQRLSAYESYRRAQAQLEDQQQGAEALSLERREKQVEQAELQLREAQARLEDAVLTAPFDGVISQINLVEGQPTVTELPAVRIIDTSTFYVELRVDEIDIGRVAVGQTAEITLDAYPNAPVEGQVDRISRLPEEVAGVVAYPVRIAITEPGSVSFRDGMTASARLVTQELENVLLIPNWAVRTDQSTAETYTYCHCIEGEEISRVPIEVGAQNETYTQILSGLEEGQTVALVSEQVDLFEFRGPPSTGGGPSLVDD